MSQGAILFFGDSHIQAVRKALQKTESPFGDRAVRVYRLTKIKNGGLLGDVGIDDFGLLCAELGPDDLVVSLTGGNQHAAISLVQHPRPFDIHGPDGSADEAVPGAEFIPRNALKAAFRERLDRDLVRIRMIAAAGPHRTVHLMSPPPKDDEAHILRQVETAFAARGIVDKGVSPAPLRQRMWQLQYEVMTELLAEDGIPFLPPPDGTMTADGFLRPAYYAEDATHANASYGKQILHQIADFAAAAQPVPG